MKTFYVTVGQRYATEPHPLGLHPDGWMEVTASGEWEARTAIVKACGTKWANLYTEDDFAKDRAYYSKGCLAKLTAT